MNKKKSFKILSGPPDFPYHNCPIVVSMMYVLAHVFICLMLHVFCHNHVYFGLDAD